MAIAQAVTCDACGKQKGEVNHWFYLLPASNFHLSVWDAGADALGAQHLCGAECVIKAVNKWMQEQAA